MICTYWEGTVGGERISCTEEAVVRQGIRCPNGCWGEGEFDFACASHREKMESGPEWLCMKCDDGTLLEVFPVQGLV